jgi:hypothetical protein
MYRSILERGELAKSELCNSLLLIGAKNERRIKMVQILKSRSDFE